MSSILIIKFAPWNQSLSLDPLSIFVYSSLGHLQALILVLCLDFFVAYFNDLIGLLESYKGCLTSLNYQQLMDFSPFWKMKGLLVIRLGFFVRSYRNYLLQVTRGIQSRAAWYFYHTVEKKILFHRFSKKPGHNLARLEGLLCFLVPNLPLNYGAETLG